MPFFRTEKGLSGPPLFYDACLSRLPDDPWGEVRYALVCDEPNTVLAVLQQHYPYRGTPIVISSLVCTRTESPSNRVLRIQLAGLRRLLKFLTHLLQASQPSRHLRCCMRRFLWLLASSIHMKRGIALFLHGGIRSNDVEDAFLKHHFKMQ